MNIFLVFKDLFFVTELKKRRPLFYQFPNNHPAHSMATILNTKEQEIFVFFRMTRPTLGPTQLPNAGVISWDKAAGV
jgi:hypothetical protein